MRSFLSFLLTLVAMAATVVAVPSIWLDQRIVDQEGFVSTVAPMAQNQKVKDYLADEIAAQATARTDLPIAGALVRPLAARYTDTEQFRLDFADVVGQQHEWLFTEPAPGADTSVMQLDITAMINRALNLTGTGNEISGPVVVELTNGASGLEAGRYAEVGKQITLLGWSAAAVAVLAALVALLVARRRGTVFAWLGVGVVAAGASTWAIGVFFADRAKQEVAGAERSGREVAELIIDGAYDDVTRVALIVGGVGVAMFAVGVLGRLVFAGRR
ncbi:hypothetical protein GDN83_07040 [Gordonia jinghuaiqii]|uniref:Integral membrane protein n=1 Tax=Gordonia jinghuaiqii TaxID=2758710 RepID=A0A7D7QID4_9ACTN|nr:hypothetical protein [Gordonia jinghuaiqii]MCR5977494.1 hypothetical protein [Gordonia jinghuaiqii]QMT02184.1 hypothetical protein H1R19_03115 [Gordonia jinghuaiqii]